jgi:hypothetical protein
MRARSEGQEKLNASEPCRGDCSGYGSRCCCPPLIVLAARTGHGAHRVLDQASHDGRTAEARALQTRDYFADSWASSEYCSCTLAYHAQQAGIKIEM